MTRRGIALLAPDALTITQNAPEFSKLTADTLGHEITDKDGWDKEISDLAALFTGGDDLLKAMGDHLLDADFVDGDIDSSLLAPVALDTAGMVSDGQTLFDSMTDAITPPAPPPPPDGGGGGGGGGSGGGGGTGDVAVCWSSPGAGGPICYVPHLKPL